jgi:hypothetical protein
LFEDIIRVLFTVVLPILIGVCVLAILYFLSRAFGARGKVQSRPYAVGRQEARHSFQVSVFRAIAAAVLALIFLAIFTVGTQTEIAAPPPTPSPTTEPATVPPASQTPQPAAPVPSDTASPTPHLPPATQTPVPTETITQTPVPPTAIVSSGVGVWLRSAPGTQTDQIEWLLDGTVVTLLAEQQMSDDILWQQVQTEAGANGWVAAEFLVSGELPTPTPETLPATGTAEPTAAGPQPPTATGEAVPATEAAQPEE